MNKLEEIIKQNREEFDTEIPSEMLWNSIHAKLQKQKNGFSWKPYAAAASIMLFIAFTWLIANHKFNGPDLNSTSSIPAEIKEAQVQFASLIELKRNELNQYKATNPSLIKDFEYQLIELQKNYATLLPQLKDENKRDLVLQAVIENLQMQVNILNQQIEIINQLKTSKNETEEIVPL